MAQTIINVAICGGGISGLCLAVALSKYPAIHVELFEAADSFSEIGAGMLIWSRTQKIIELMGLGTQFSNIIDQSQYGEKPPSSLIFEYRRSDQREPASQFYQLSGPSACVHRAHFLDILASQLPPGIVHFNSRLESYISSGSTVTLNFANKSRRTCNLLVGCDGIKSAIRQQMFRDLATLSGNQDYLRYVDPVWTGTTVYRALIPVAHLEKVSNGEQHLACRNRMVYCGKNKHINTYPIRDGYLSMVNVVACCSDRTKLEESYPQPWVRSAPQEELLTAFENWEPDVQELLNRMPKPTHWAIHHLRPLPHFTTGRVVLIGDAAHASAPHLGAGAGSAIEDAYVLSNLLGNMTNFSSLPHILKAFEHVRLPSAHHVLKESYNMGNITEFDGGFGEEMSSVGAEISRQCMWFDQTDPDGENKRALDYLASLEGPTKTDTLDARLVAWLKRRLGERMPHIWSS